MGMVRVLTGVSILVPRVQLAMKLMGLDAETLDRVCYRTPRDFLALPLE
jgi:hypothetical protein